jgi:hypothetical protein
VSYIVTLHRDQDFRINRTARAMVLREEAIKQAELAAIAAGEAAAEAAKLAEMRCCLCVSKA